MFPMSDYFRFRLRLKRYAFFIILGIYVISFFYILSITKSNQKNASNAIAQEETTTSENSFTSEFNKHDNLMKEIAVLVLVCDRSTVTRTLDQLLKHRLDPKSFPIVVSHDCGDEGKTVSSMVRQKYGKKLTYLTHPNYEATRATIADIPAHMKGYYHIAAHYAWALNYTFDKLGFANVIIVEDDLDISPDFFEFFSATLPLLYQDSSLWCVSAYNDNGKSELIDLQAPELLYRTDFFPGLGWMLTKDLWAELSEKWPTAFWDDWMRLPDQRKKRACIHPEISRTKTYGRIGVSNGQFFDAHLQSIKLNNAFVPFKSQDLTYLAKNEYDNIFLARVNLSMPVKSLEDFEATIQDSSSTQNSYRLTYESQLEFKRMARHIGLMDDFKSGVPRGGYDGIVSVFFKQKRLYLIPLQNQ